MRKKDPNALNKREKAILKFIEKSIKNNGYPPSVREIGKSVGLKSTATVHGYLASLEEKGYIKKESQKGRTLKLLKGGLDDELENQMEIQKEVYTSREMVDVPVIGKIPASIIDSPLTVSIKLSELPTKSNGIGNVSVTFSTASIGSPAVIFPITGTSTISLLV